MKDKATFWRILFCVSFLVVGCSSQPGPPERGPADAQAPAPESPEVAEPPPQAKQEPPQPAAPSPEVPPTPVVVDIGGPVEVAAPKSGLTRIGAEKCKICHKVQYASWSETAHATRSPPLDCEGCHGPGSEYKGMSVMKDPVRAKEAGLVYPDRAFCSQCHTSGWTDEQFERAHAHKVEGN